MLALFKALQGLKVDIVTSNKVLAKRDAIDKNEFYSMFSISCTHNTDENIDKDCYK